MIKLLEDSSFSMGVQASSTPKRSSTSPSVIGSLVSQSMAIIDEHDSPPEHTSPSFSYNESSHDAEDVQRRLDYSCPNCKILEGKVKELKKTLEHLSK